MIVTTKMGYNKSVDAFQKRLCIALCWFVLSIFLANIALGVQENFGVSQHLVSNCLKIITVLIFIWGLSRPIMQNSTPTVLTVIFILPLCVYSILYSAENIYIKDNIIRFVIFVFPVIILSLYIDNFDCLYCALKKVSLWIGHICFLILIMFFVGIKFFCEDYSMGLSYSCLLPLLVLLPDSIKKLTFTNSTAVISLLSVIFFFGSRGALLCVAAYFIFLLLQKKQFKIIYYGCFTLFVFVCIIYCFGDSIVTYLLAKNITARSLMLFLNFSKEGVHLSGRERLYVNTMKGINNTPWQFKGMFASYTLNEGSYPHNIFLEAWYDLGILSVLFFCITVWGVFKSFCYKGARGDIVIMLMAYNVSLLVSGSFWLMPYFWMWLIFALKNATVTELDDDEYYESAK